VFGSVVVGAFQIVFRAEMHANDIFLFFKNHFWHQHIKTIKKVQTALNFSKKKKFKFRGNAGTNTVPNVPLPYHLPPWHHRKPNHSTAPLFFFLKIEYSDDWSRISSSSFFFSGLHIFENTLELQINILYLKKKLVTWLEHETFKLNKYFTHF